ncbi:hypothetical protein [Desulfoluna butyratoxydans]|uniref:Uncharacterized protein n=1 Tax=Desulfoluna butyratoxydans TaxID=231438 RepID=A0A4U8YHP9_9BACT|nr:hypothetical protein [Desulfoluna butyratoxydans]VFQ43116.1 hypothetical protein MSL71_7430 [Desulfoluna butyratoxydans]
MDYSQINSADALVLMRMEVAGTLEIWAEESKENGKSSPRRPPRLFHIAFPGEIMALESLNASYTREADAGTYSGTLLRTYKASPFLDYVRAETYAASTMKHPLHHFQLITEEAIIDVVTITPPQVDEVSLG